MGRRTRSIPPAIRRALGRRDPGCRFPGCTAHRFVDAHHIRHWADGGETKLNNLVLLCRHHHRALTARHQQDGLAIGPQTPIPDWDGAPMGDTMAVEGLLQRE